MMAVFSKLNKMSGFRYMRPLPFLTFLFISAVLLPS